MIVIYDTLGSYGGSHTLMLRMCEWLKNHDINVSIACIDDSNHEIVDRLKRIGVNVIKADFQYAKKGKLIIQKMMAKDNLSFICFSWIKYLDIERIKKKYHFEFNNILYCIHPETFLKGRSLKARLLINYSKRIYGRIFKRMVDNNSIISVDPQYIIGTYDYFDFCYLKSVKTIPIPMLIPNIDNYENIIKKGFESNIIMTAARAEFPYKGYLIGLIDDFDKISKDYKNTELVIVSSGDDIQLLKDKINSKVNNCLHKIKLISWLNYDELKDEMKKAKVFIGMGTTVFDAALLYKPSIVVAYNTFDNLSDHFVEENPLLTASNPKCTNRAITYLKQALGWSFDEYRSHCINSFTKVRNSYDADNCMKTILNHHPISEKSILSLKECIRHVVNRRINNLRFKNSHFAEISRIGK